MERSPYPYNHGSKSTSIFNYQEATIYFICMLLSLLTTITRQYANPGKGYKWWYIHNASQRKNTIVREDRVSQNKMFLSNSTITIHLTQRISQNVKLYLNPNFTQCIISCSNVITANCRMSNPWHTSGSNSVLWLHIWPYQSCTYERFRVQVDRQDWGQSTVSILRARPAPHIKTC